MGRRRFLGIGAALGAAAVAGCTGSVPDGSTSGGSIAQQLGTFRLLISDQPVAIDEFDSLVVQFEEARIFRARDGGDDERDESAEVEGEQAEDEQDGSEDDVEAEQASDDEPVETEEPSPTDAGADLQESAEGPESPDANQTETDDGVEAASQDQADGDGDDQEGFRVIDLNGESADLTNLVGEKAQEVFGGSMPAGRYAKIELYATSVEGIVNDAEVGVTIPSDTLQIRKPFEVGAGETVSFVFDINVVKKGPEGGYNLLPVIAKSGVAGQDVEVQEVDADGDPVEASDAQGTGGTDDGTETENGEEQGGPPEGVPADGRPTETASPEA